MKRFFRWRHWRARAKFWRGRALKAEGQLEAERWRNLEREDTLVTVPMRLGGLWGMPARDAPAPVKQVNRRPAQLTASTDPWDTLTGADMMEFDLEWKGAAEAAGVPLSVAKQQFLAEVIMPRRMPLNDDPYSTN
jgi:hypothetical protein